MRSKQNVTQRSWLILAILSLFLIIVACGDDEGTSETKTREGQPSDYDGVYAITFKTKELPTAENGYNTREHVLRQDLTVKDGIGTLVIEVNVSFNLGGIPVEVDVIFQGDFQVDGKGNITGDIAASADIPVTNEQGQPEIQNISIPATIEGASVKDDKVEGKYFFVYNEQKIAEGNVEGFKKPGATLPGEEGVEGSTGGVQGVSPLYDGLYEVEFTHKQRTENEIEESPVLVACLAIQGGLIQQVVEPEVFQLEGAVDAKGRFYIQATETSQFFIVGEGIVSKTGQLAGSFNVDQGFSGAFVGQQSNTCKYQYITPPAIISQQEAEAALGDTGGLPNALEPSAEELSPNYHVLCNMDVDTTGESIGSFVVGVLNSVEVPIIGDIFTSLDRGDSVYCKRANRCKWLDEVIQGYSSQDECLAECDFFAEQDPRFTECKGLLH